MTKGEKFGKIGENVKLEWIAPFGPEKGQKVTSWFYAEEPEVKHIIDDLGGKIIDRR